MVTRADAEPQILHYYHIVSAAVGIGINPARTA